MMQIFVSDKGFVKVYGMKGLRQISDAIKLFAKEVGAPNAFVCDPHANQTSHQVRDFCHKIGSTLRVLEQGTQASNRAELYVGLIKEGIRKDMREMNSPCETCRDFQFDSQESLSIGGAEPLSCYLW